MRFAILSAGVILLAACSAASTVTPSPGSAGGNSMAARGEHVVQAGGAVYRFGGMVRPSSSNPGWISHEAVLKPILYAASYNGGFVNIYPAGGNNQAPIGQLTSGLTSPQGVAVDKYHRLWVANTNAFNVVAFKRGETTPFRTLSDPNYYPTSVAVDSNNTVYAANAESTTGPPGNITVWAHGSTTPTATLTDPSFEIVTNIGVDAKNNVYVSYIPTSGPPALMKFAAGSSKGKAIAIQDANLGDITFDTSKNLVMETLSNTLGVWAPPYTSGPVRQINAFGNEPQFDASEYKVCVAYANPNTPDVVCYNYKTGALVDTITNGWSSNAIPYGIAFDPAAPR